MSTGNPSNDTMHRQSSRTALNADTIECIVNTSDLAFEDDRISQEPDRRRSSSDARRTSTSKRSNGATNDRSSRHSPSTVTYKHSSSPSSTSLLSSRSQHHYSASNRQQRVSGSPSPSPPPSSSRHSRSSRPAIPAKRPHSRSPPDRRPSSAHRSYPKTSKKRPADNDELTSTTSVRKQTVSTKASRKPDAADLSTISEDELTKPSVPQVQSSTVDESSSVDKLHSTPSVPVLRPISNKSLLDMSDIPQEAELSLYAKSSLSVSNISSAQPTPTAPVYDIMQTIELMSKYKAMHSIPSNNPEVERCSQGIFALIQQQIELHKQELDHRKREMELCTRELGELERRFEEKSGRQYTAVNSKPEIEPKSTSVKEKPQQPMQQVETASEQATKTAFPVEPEKQMASATTDASKTSFVRTDSLEKPSSGRSGTHRSRFSALTVDPSIFPLQNKPALDLYADVEDEHLSSASANPNNLLKKPVLSPILAPDESAKPLMDHDLKVTSSNSFRKVEIQGDHTHSAEASKDPPQDLRLTLRNNRNKQQNSDDNKAVGDQPLSNSEDQSVNVPVPTLTKTISNDNNSDDKQQSHDYQQQRSISSTSNDTTIDDIVDKRSHRANSSRQQPYPRDYSSSNERSYSHRPMPYQSSRSGPHQRRYEPGDSHSRYVEQRYPKSTRPPHRGYH